MNDFDEKEAIKQEEEIKKIINKIVAKEHNNELVDFSDYRNYMEYEVIVHAVTGAILEIGIIRVPGPRFRIQSFFRLRWL